MELEAWHLLVLPLFFVLGWAAERVDIRHVMRESRAVPASYFKGLNFLLNEQPDKAIEAFVEVARLDPDTLELHYALGALFRRRGELERAIRIHQNLVDRSDLTQDQRLKALYELGQDFFKAGLLDRAEDVFKGLDTGIHALDALRHLVDIYVLEKDWEQAIAMARRLEKLGSPLGRGDIAHYHCEIALNAMLRENPDAARAQLGAALEADRNCVRALQLLGDIEAKTGNDEDAIANWRQIERHNPSYLPLVAERLFQAYERIGQTDEGIALLKDYLDRYPSPDLFHTLFNATLEAKGWQAAEQLASGELRRTPSLRTLDDYLQARTADGDSVELETRLAQDLVHRQVSRLSYYQCGHCGFKSRQFFWQCPACARWEGIPPVRIEHEN